MGQPGVPADRSFRFLGSAEQHRCTAAWQSDSPSVLHLQTRHGRAAYLPAEEGQKRDDVVMVAPLFAASKADLTIERIRALAARADQLESQTLEFKRE